MSTAEIAKKDRVVTLAESDALKAMPALNPQALIAKALDMGAGIETLERLVQLAKDVRQISAREAYFEAIAKFKSECPRITKDATANAGQYSYNYATLDGILATVEPVLGKHGLTISWRQKHEGNSVFASCVVTHKLGHQEESGFIGVPFETAGRMNPAQRVGSAATYAKRYSLLAVLGLAPEEDDDARGTTDPKPTRAAETPTRGGTPSQPNTEVSPMETTQTFAPTSSAREQPIDTTLGDEADRLFPDPQDDVERESLLNDIFRMRDTIAASKTTPKEKKTWETDRKEAWITYVGDGVSPSMADLAALNDVKKWLETRMPK